MAKSIEQQSFVNFEANVSTEYFHSSQLEVWGGWTGYLKILNNNPLLEISSGSLEWTGLHPQLLAVQANTSHGLFNLHAIPHAHVGEETLADFLKRLERQYRRSTGTTVFFPVSLQSNQCAGQTSTANVLVIDTNTKGEAGDIEEWASSTTEILKKLVSTRTTKSEKFGAILFAEILPFSGDERDQLIRLLLDFVREQRFVQNAEVQAAVGSAIRKLALNLPIDLVEEYAELLTPTETDTLPCEVELELVKSIVWRLSESPDQFVGVVPRLESRMTELAQDYLRPRIILQRNYASTTIHAVLGVLLVGGKMAKELAEQITKLGIEWFSDLFQRRLHRLMAELASQQTAAETCRRLQSLARQVESGKG